MVKRFQGNLRRAELLRELRKQYLVDGNSQIAEHIALAAQVKEYAAGMRLFRQNERSSHLCFILAGQVSVRVDGKEIATVGAGLHVWEIGLPEPFRGRTATATALQTVVVAQLSGHRFTEIARLYPVLWRRVALGYVQPTVKGQSVR